MLNFNHLNKSTYFGIKYPNISHTLIQLSYSDKPSLYDSFHLHLRPETKINFPFKWHIIKSY